MTARRSVLSIYRKILQTSKTWKAVSEKDTQEEQKYILNEARKLFRKNMHLTDPKQIQTCMQEAEARLEIAIHYKTPYPRPVNIPYLGLSPSMSKGKKFQEKLRKQAKPIYLHSQDET